MDKQANEDQLKETHNKFEELILKISQGTNTGTSSSQVIIPQNSGTQSSNLLVPFPSQGLASQASGIQPWANTIKLQSQPTFGGKESENVENWLSLLKINFELNRLHIDDWISVAATYLRDGPLKVYVSKKPTLRMTDWQSFYSFMLDNNGTKIFTNVLLEMLTNLRQIGSLRIYIDKFVEIANQIDDTILSQKAKTLHFVSKLTPELKKVTGLKI